jgi:hypothetical protein
MSPLSDLELKTLRSQKPRFLAHYGNPKMNSVTVCNPKQSGPTHSFADLLAGSPEETPKDPAVALLSKAKLSLNKGRAVIWLGADPAAKNLCQWGSSASVNRLKPPTSYSPAVLEVGASVSD